MDRQAVYYKKPGSCPHGGFNARLVMSGVFQQSSFFNTP